MIARKLKKGFVLVEVISGAEGPSLSIGDENTGERVAGPKPWGGGRVIHQFEVRAEDLRRLADSYGNPEPQQ